MPRARRTQGDVDVHPTIRIDPQAAQRAVPGRGTSNSASGSRSGQHVRHEGRRTCVAVGVETDLARGTHVDPRRARSRSASSRRSGGSARRSGPRTRDDVRLAVAARLLAAFADSELRSITPTNVRAWHGRLSRSGLISNTVAKIYRLLPHDAVDGGRRRPAAVEPVTHQGRRRRAVSASDRRSTWDDVRGLAEAIEPRFEALVWTAATSALRYGELTGLTRAQLDLDASTLRVEQSLAFIKGVGPVLGPPKSDAAHRTVVIPGSARELLAAHLEQFTDPGSTALVFTSVKGSPLLNRYFAPYWHQRRRPVASTMPSASMTSVTWPARPRQAPAHPSRS